MACTDDEAAEGGRREREAQQWARRRECSAVLNCAWSLLQKLGSNLLMGAEPAALKRGCGCECGFGCGANMSVGAIDADSCIEASTAAATVVTEKTMPMGIV